MITVVGPRFLANRAKETVDFTPIPLIILRAFDASHSIRRTSFSSACNAQLLLLLLLLLLLRVCVRIVTVKIMVVFLFGTIGGDVLGKTWTVNWERASASVFELQHTNAICVCAFVKTEEAFHRSKFKVPKSLRIQIFHNSLLWLWCGKSVISRENLLELCKSDKQLINQSCRMVVVKVVIYFEV